MTTKQHILNAMADEAQYVAKTARMDLDAFLALDTETRGARWQQFDYAAKFQLVAQQCSRSYGDWSAELVEAWIARYDEKWGTAPAATEAAVAGALERLAETHQRSAEAAAPGEERTYFRRWAGAFRKALYVYQQGVRPEQTPGGAWLVASATRAGQVHQVTRDGQCSCEAQNRGCWHAALITGVETSYDDLDRYDGGEDGGERLTWCCAPDDPCSLDDPCPAHADRAREYLAEQGNAALAALAAELESEPAGWELAEPRRPARAGRPLSGYAAMEAERERRAHLAEERALLAEGRARLAERIAEARARYLEARHAA